MFANSQYPELGDNPIESEVTIYNADSCNFYMPTGSIRGAYQSNYFYYAAAPNASPAYTTGLDMSCNGVSGGFDNNNKVYNLTMTFELLLNGSYYTSDVQNNLTFAYQDGEVGHVFASKKLGVGSVSLSKVTDQGSDGVMIFNVTVTTDKVVDLTYPIVISLSSTNQNIGGLTGKNTFFGMARNFTASGVINGNPIAATNEKLDSVIKEQQKSNGILSVISNAVNTVIDSIGSVIDSIGNILKSIGELPGKIWQLVSDGLIGLFVPSDGFFTDLVNELKSELEAQFGFLYTAAESFVSFLSVFVSSHSPANSITFPSFSLPGIGQIWGDMEFPILESTIYSKYKTVFQPVLIAAISLGFLFWCVRQFKNILHGDKSEGVEDS